VALRWRDIDWTAGVIRVRRNYTRGHWGAPKSRRSSRAVPMITRTAGALDRLFKSSQFQADDDLVFAHPELGSVLDASKLRKRFKATLAAAGVRPVRFHDLRHTFGTQAAASGVPLRTLQEWMGHRDYKTTLIYADHAPRSEERQMVERAFAAAPTPLESVRAGSRSIAEPRIHARESLVRNPPPQCWKALHYGAAGLGASNSLRRSRADMPRGVYRARHPASVHDHGPAQTTRPV
jgi:Phage integrase family